MEEKKMERKNVFAKVKKHEEFAWENLGNIKEGRGDLGEGMPVLVYRLMQFTMLDVIAKDVGVDKANEYFRKAGFLAGYEFSKNALDLTVEFDTFIANLRQVLEDLKIGILRMEAFNPETGAIQLTVAQDLDCSGLPITHENVCTYDEGFIAGILEAFTGKKYDVREIDCWASGDRVCRFSGVVV
jgi:predicted hydrocarbon binding protein